MGAAFDLGEGAAAVAEDRLLAGPVALDLREAFLVEPGSAVASAHLSAMWAALPVDKPARGAGKWWAAGAVGVVLFGGSLAGAGALPGPVQHAVAGALHPIGVRLPDPDTADDPGTSDSTGSWQQAPGQQTQPGESENAPGHGGSGPGQSDVAPGHSSTLPPQSNGVATPGRPDDPGKPADAGLPPDEGKAPDVTPGNGGEPPGATAPSNGDANGGEPAKSTTTTTKAKSSPASSGGAGASGAPAGGDTGKDK